MLTTRELVWKWIEPGFPILLSVVMGIAIGILVYDVRREWIGDSLLVSLEHECRSYMGDRAMLVYHEKRFYCLPERP